jgi:hypothetical protein
MQVDPSARLVRKRAGFGAKQPPGLLRVLAVDLVRPKTCPPASSAVLLGVAGSHRGSRPRHPRIPQFPDEGVAHVHYVLPCARDRPAQRHLACVHCLPCDGADACGSDPLRRLPAAVWKELNPDAAQ